MDTLVSLKNINVIKHKKVILKDINIDIKKNDFITIVGPNGAGKSMLLKCIMKFYSPTSGSLYCDKNLKIGYVPQRIVPNVLMPLKVEYFLTLNNKIFHNDFYLDIVKKTNISSLLSLDINSLSGGQMQRVLVARALLRKPNFLILDEPAQNLDIQHQIIFYQMLDDIYKKNNMTILMVSHDLHYVIKSSTKTICLFHHICCQGEPQDIVNNPAMIDIFGDDGANILKQYNHTKEHIHHHHEDECLKEEHKCL